MPGSAITGHDPSVLFGSRLEPRQPSYEPLSLGAEALWDLEVESGRAQSLLFCTVERGLIKWAKGQSSCTECEGQGQSAAQLQEWLYR